MQCRRLPSSQPHNCRVLTPSCLLLEQTQFSCLLLMMGTQVCASQGTTGFSQARGLNSGLQIWGMCLHSLRSLPDHKVLLFIYSLFLKYTPFHQLKTEVCAGLSKKEYKLALIVSKCIYCEIFQKPFISQKHYNSIENIIL